jgi:hypothetical protein
MEANLHQEGPFECLDFETSQFLCLCSSFAGGPRPPVPQDTPATLNTLGACGGPARAPGLVRRRLSSKESREQSRSRVASGATRRGGAGRCARTRGARRRVTSVRHVPVFTSLVEPLTSAAEWQHCGDAEAQTLGDASVGQAGSARWGGGRAGAEGSAPRAAKPYSAPPRPRRLASREPQTQSRGLAQGAAGRPSARRCGSAGLVNRSGRT